MDCQDPTQVRSCILKKYHNAALSLSTQVFFKMEPGSDIWNTNDNTEGHKCAGNFNKKKGEHEL